ncbi:hypothetical protein PILCRDRAFT_826705 [Piloderma croceum F 1598]|uniref:ethanolamine-phosphate cytidylyltransferase n=1 Tax=Piloderma croceum (strain F 1598) TaxID=765440 RepID=A0A0C3F833_PILCF|nr:hypothetical protein PILCRDRAFT_826705 [Piloderma croceum F 1598]
MRQATIVSQRSNLTANTKSSSEREFDAWRCNPIVDHTHIREGISTTSLIQRILEPGLPLPDQGPLRNLLDVFAGSIFPPPAIIDLDSPGRFEFPRHGDTKVVYVGGSWDCFSAGHVEYLRRSKAAVRVNGRVMLAVGLWSDKTIRDVAGDPPFLLLMERALAVIQCRHADALILNAPCDISISTYNSLAIDIVVNGDKDSCEIGVKVLAVTAVFRVFPTHCRGRLCRW